MQLILNADDLGLSIAVNDAIFELMEQGLISSATIMANGDAVDDAVERSKRFPQCSFGIHLVATEFRPVSRDERLKPLLDTEGCLYRWPSKSLRDPRVLIALFNEFRDQILLLRRKGVRISHIDSHHHVHTLPQLFPVITILSRRFSIKRMRITRNLFQPNENVSLYKRTAKLAWIAAVQCAANVATTDYFGTIEDLSAQGHQFGQSKVAEIMVHPGHPAYGHEEVILRTTWLQRLPFPVNLTNYAKLRM